MKKLILCFAILLLLPLISAGNYGASTYGAGVYSGGATVASITPPPSGGGSGGCSYNWQCTNWFPSECPESEIQERICANKGTCTDTIGMPTQIQICNYTGPTEPLFDIFLSIPQRYTKICAGRKIKANIKLENYGKIELLDAFMTYWVINENNTLIAEVKDTRAVENKINFNTEIKIPESAPEGTYRLYAQITYSENKTAVAGESFEIIEGESCKKYSILLNFFLDNKTYLLYSVGFLIIIIFIIIFTRKRKKSKKKVKKKRKAKNLFRPIFKKKRKEKTYVSYKKRISKAIEKNKN